MDDIFVFDENVFVFIKMSLELTVDEILSSGNVKVGDASSSSFSVELFDVATMLWRGVGIDFKYKKMLEIRDINYICDKFY